MCKLFATTSLSIASFPAVRAAVFAAMATTERDGLGAAWSTQALGKLGRVRASDINATRGDLPPFCEGFSKLEDHAYDGGPLICHGRTSTNFVSLANTHPFTTTKEGTVYMLAHNGVVTSDKYKVNAGGCDTELILKAFVSGGIKEIAKHISGYYALLILEKSKKGGQRLHVIRDGTANLHCGRIGDAWAFATTTEILRAAGAVPLSEFKRRTHAIFEGNNLVSCKEFNPSARTVYSAGFQTQFDRAFAGQTTGKSYTGKGYTLKDIEAEQEEEKRLQKRLQEMEAKGGLTPTKELEDETLDDDDDDAPTGDDVPMSERGMVNDWPANLGRGVYD